LDDDTLVANLAQRAHGLAAALAGNSTRNPDLEHEQPEQEQFASRTQF
jgi:hypothetical protein